MIKRNFLIVVLLFFFKILFIQCTEKEVKIRYIHYDSKNVSKFISPKKETKLKIKNKKITKAEVKDLLKNTEYSYDGLPDNFEGDYNSYLIEIYKLNDKYEYSDRFNVLSEDVDEITLDEEKYNKIDESYSVDFIFFTDSAIKNIRKSKISKVKVNETILELNDKIEIYKYLEFLPNNEINPIFKEITKQDLTGTINLKKESFGEALLNITFAEYLKNIDEKSLNSCEIKNNDKEYNCYSDKSEDLIFEFNCKIKRNVNITINIPDGFVLDLEAKNNFKSDISLDNFTIEHILKKIAESLQKYFKNLFEEKKKSDPNTNINFIDYDVPEYKFNITDYHLERIDPINYTFKNIKNETLEITKNEDINNNIFNLENGSKITINVGENFEYLKTMFADIDLNPIEGTELNGKIAKKYHKILLNLNKDLKKQIVDYFKSKQFEGFYIPEDFYEYILNIEEAYKNHSDFFTLKINLNEKAKGTFLKPKGAPDPDLEYFKNYKEEDGKPIEPQQPQYIPPVQEQKETPKLDKNTQCCATCGGKCLKCSNCNKKDR